VRLHRDQPLLLSSTGSLGAKEAWGPASQSDLTGRRMVTEASSEQHRRVEFLRQINALNDQFGQYVADSLRGKLDHVLVDAGNDYIQYVEALEERFLRRHGEVFMFGSGECGQLAHGIDSEDDLNVDRPRIVYSLRDKHIRLLACGGIHTIAVGADGRVWSWGCNDDGALGRPSGLVDKERPELGSKGNENMPEIVAGGGLQGEQVVHVSCGDCQTLVVTVDGNVYGWGCYKDREGKKWFDSSLPPSASPQEAVKTIKRQQDVPMKILALPETMVADLCCGASFNAALLKDGRVLTWGLGEVGELGRPAAAMKPDGAEYDKTGVFRDHVTPGAPVLASGEALPAMKSVGCGMYHLFVVSASGSSVYSAGLNVYGQLGLGYVGDGLSNKDKLEAVQSLDGQGVACCTGGNHHSMALTGDGRVFTWGRADYGQLGIARADTAAGGYQASPIEVEFPAGAASVTRVSCGNNHNLVLTSKKQVYSWGFGDSGALGHASDEDEMCPRMIDFKKAKLEHIDVLQLAGGGQHSALLGSVTTTK